MPPATPTTPADARPQPAEEWASPVGRYRPQVLVLAPPEREDGNTLSLAAQLLELGVAVELDAQWHLPRVPPRDLSAYQACLFPESVKAQYDHDLNAFIRGGGFVPYMKYFPVDPAPLHQVDHAVNPVSFHGRDVMMQHIGAMVLQAAVTEHEPDFLHTLAHRPLRSIAADICADSQTRYAPYRTQPWDHWSDPDAFALLSRTLGALAAGDQAHLDLLRPILDNVRQHAADLLRTDKRISAQIDGIVEPYVILFGWLLLCTGQWLDRPADVARGLELAQFWYDHNAARGQVHSNVNGRGFFSEELFALPGLCALERLAGHRAAGQAAERIAREVTEHCLRPDGIWAHWVNHRGERQGPWSRATYWPVLGLTFAVLEMEPTHPRRAWFLELLETTFHGLAAYQDPQRGVWRNLLDEPTTRLETSSAAAFVLCHDRLRQAGLLSQTHAGMIDHALRGLKQLCYRGGLCAFCRGTDYGPRSYYRARPHGYSPSSHLLAGVVGQRLAPHV